MTDMKALKTALITGASSGIGAAFAEVLARQGLDLVLVARSEDKLRVLAGRLTRDTGRNIQVVALDLTRPSPGTTLKRIVDGLGMSIDLLINNAGFGTTGAFELQDAEREADEIRLNAGAVVDLAHAFLPDMLVRGSGAVINVASSAAFQPMPYFAVYAATKAFVLSFSDALWAETRQRGVHVMAVCPGPVDTPFFDVAGTHGLREKIPKGSVVTAEFVVRCTLDGLESRQRLVIPGAMTKVGAAASSILPRSVLTRFVGRMMKP